MTAQRVFLPLRPLGQSPASSLLTKLRPQPLRPLYHVGISSTTWFSLLSAPRTRGQLPISVRSRRSVSYFPPQPQQAQQPYQPPPPPPPPPPAKPKGRIRSLFSLIFFSQFFYIFGAFIGLAYVLYKLNELITLETKDAIATFQPEDPESQTIQDYINNHPLVAELRSQPNLKESRPHLHQPHFMKDHSLTASTLAGPDLVAVPAYQWADERDGSITQIFHVGSGLCGHPGIVHGGFVATVLDEGLANSAFLALPKKAGVTAYLNIDYRAPTHADSYVVLRAKPSRVEGRKAWIKGSLETLPPAEGSSKPVVLAEAEALFVTPRNNPMFDQADFLFDLMEGRRK